eukprot:977146-Pelagomonas_calceolata.AAC.6
MAVPSMHVHMFTKEQGKSCPFHLCNEDGLLTLRSKGINNGVAAQLQESFPSGAPEGEAY